MRLLTLSSAKTSKGEGYGYLTGILYLSPDAALCPASTPACRAACLVGAGRARIFSTIGTARKRRTERFRADRAAFIADLMKDVRALARRAAKKGLKAALRINGTSDIDPQELREVYAHAASLSVTTYEYTKRRDTTRAETCTTYSLPTPDAPIMPGEGNAQVFAFRRGAPLPETYRGFRVIDGDKHDLRFLDRVENDLSPEQTYIVGLRLKTTTKKRNAYAIAQGFAV